MLVTLSHWAGKSQRQSCILRVRLSILALVSSQASRFLLQGGLAFSSIIKE